MIVVRLFRFDYESFKAAKPKKETQGTEEKGRKT